MLYFCLVGWTDKRLDGSLAEVFIIQMIRDNFKICRDVISTSFKRVTIYYEEKNEMFGNHSTPPPLLFFDNISKKGTMFLMPISS